MAPSGSQTRTHIARVRPYENRYPHANMPRVAGTDGPAASTIIKCRGLLRDIATNLGTTVDNLDEVNCDSQGFLRALKAILEQRGINNVDGLAPVLDEIRVFREKRKAGGASKGSSHGD
ncbi:hypothetical protein FALBO_16891, partial [Fusarium albosuccineum]